MPLERYHKFHVGFIHGPTTLIMYDFRFWSPRCPLLLPLKGSLLEGSLLPPPKGLPLSLLIGRVRPLLSSLLTFPIRDGFPFWSWYDFPIKTIHGILGLCFLLE
jgi:hypothetical protein